MASNKERYAALQSAVMEQDFEKIRGFIAEDFVMMEPDALPYAGKFVGPEGFVDVVRQIRERYEIDIVSSVISEAENDVLLCEFVFGFKSLRTGERVVMPVIDIFRFSPDGKLLRGDIYYQDAAKVAAIA
ncbi:MAG: nuclear transport factor 2 family protein [Caulobacter sp.]|nr:nuclear transport factor 2 family protein [Caulobacter sp.]